MTPLTLVPAVASARSEHDRTDRRFFLAYLAIAWAVVAAGFGPRTLSHLTGDTPSPPLVVHVHAAIFLGWLAYFTLQVWLANSDRAGLHRRVGFWGVGLIAPVALAGVAVSVSMARLRASQGDPYILNFLFDELMEVATFVVLTVTALAFRKTRAVHSRLMLLALIGLTTPGFARSLGHALAPATGGDTHSFVGQMVHLYPGPDLMLAGAVIYDRLTRGQVHMTYKVAVPLLLANQLVITAVCNWPAWTPIARAIAFGA